MTTLLIDKGVDTSLPLLTVTHHYVNNYRGFPTIGNPTYMQLTDKDGVGYHPPQLTGTLELPNPLYSCSYSRTDPDTTGGTLHNLLYDSRDHSPSIASEKSAEHQYEYVQHNGQQLLVCDDHTPS